MPHSESSAAAASAELIEMLDQAVVRLDAAGRITSLNTAWETQLGHGRAQSLQRTLADFVHTEDRAEFDRAWAELVAGTHRTYRGEMRFATAAGGSRWVLVALRRSETPQGEFLGAMGALTDIAEWKATEEKLRAELAAATEGSRAKIEFAASLGHELRTPLNAVIGLTESLIEVAPAFDPDRTKRYLGIIHQSGRQLLAQINDLVDISRIDAQRTKTETVAVELSALCAGIAEVARRDARVKEIEVSVAPVAAPCRVPADERLLRRAVQALVAHAVKSTPAKGRVGIEVVGRATGGAAIVVKDAATLNLTGKFAALGAPGRQLDGADLMLALVERIARWHGGGLAVAHTAGQGNTFTLELSGHSRATPAAPASHP